MFQPIFEGSAYETASDNSNVNHNDVLRFNDFIFKDLFKNTN